MSLQRRRIDVTITLGEGQWGETLGDTMTLTGYRVRAEINAQGGDAQNSASVQIFGLPADTLNRLTTIGPVATQIRAQNKILVAAGDDGGALETYFNGCIVQAWAQMQDAPNTCLVVQGQIAADISLKPVAASSYVGAAQVSNIMADFAKEAGLAFEDNGVQVVLRNPYFPGTTLSKIQSCARAARIFHSIQDGVLAIWPLGGSRQQDAIPVISPQTGMLGYPIYSQQGVTVRTLLSSKLRQGDKFTVEGSILTPANGTWTVWTVHHTMESQTPNGAWFTDVLGYGLGGQVSNG